MCIKQNTYATRQAAVAAGIAINRSHSMQLRCVYFCTQHRGWHHSHQPARGKAYAIPLCEPRLT